MSFNLVLNKTLSISTDYKGIPTGTTNIITDGTTSGTVFSLPAYYCVYYVFEDVVDIDLYRFYISTGGTSYSLRFYDEKDARITNITPVAGGVDNSLILKGVKGFSLFNIKSTPNNIFEIQIIGEIVSKNKLLIRNNNEYYYYNSPSWNSLGLNPTSGDIISYGMDSITAVQINEFESIYGRYWYPVKWTDSNSSKKVALTATPIPQILTAKNSIQLTGVVSATFKWTATGNSRVALSIDDGVTYHAYKNGIWIDVTNDMSNAMTSNEYSSLTWSQYELLSGESNFLKHQYYVPNNSTVDDILITTELMGENKLASTNDFSLSYKQESKTIQISISKSGSYFCNYIDV